MYPEVLDAVQEEICRQEENEFGTEENFLQTLNAMEQEQVE